LRTKFVTRLRPDPFLPDKNIKSQLGCAPKMCL